MPDDLQNASAGENPEAQHSASAFRHAERTAREALDDAEESLREHLDELEDLVREHPLATVGIAAGLGLIAGWILSRR